MQKLDIHIGYIGLGKMGFNMAQRLLEKGYRVTAYNKTPEPTKQLEKEGVVSAYSIEELVAATSKPRLFWLMVPYKAVDSVLEELTPKLVSGDIVIDGGNSPYIDSLRRAQEIKAKGITYMDIGVSGGPHGAREGACLMVGGPKEKYKELEKLFYDLSAEGGYGYMGDSGAGHFVKMVHNGIEYGMMQAIGEGFHVMRESEFNLNLTEIARVYNHKSVIESRLIGWLMQAYKSKGENLQGISGSVSQSGEGQWTVEAAKKMNIPIPIIEGALQFRINSQEKPSYAGQVISALRNQFGGHDVHSK